MFGPKQIVRWQEGVPEPLASSSGATDSLPAPVPALGNPWDLAWLQPPDEIRSKRGGGLYGRLVTGLASVEDVQTELRKLLAANKAAGQRPCSGSGASPWPTKPAGRGKLGHAERLAGAGAGGRRQIVRAVAAR